MTNIDHKKLNLIAASFNKTRDDHMEELLISLGYSKMVKLIRSTTRWYS